LREVFAILNVNNERYLVHILGETIRSGSLGGETMHVAIAALACAAQHQEEERREGSSVLLSPKM
jgi:hypothetical protein